MIRVYLDERVEPLRKMITDLILYNDIYNVVVEVGVQKTKDDSIFVDISDCGTLEDVLSKFALSIKDRVKKPAKYRPSSQIWLDAKHGEDSKNIASIIETAVEPYTFFNLERFTL